MDANETVARDIVRLAGGAENISHVTNCMTRVRLEVVDESKVDIEAIKKLKGVFGVHVDAQIQVIMGPGVAAKVTACVKEVVGEKVERSGKEVGAEIAAQNRAKVKSRQKQSRGKQFLKTISNIFIPLAPAFIACGLAAGLQSIVQTLIQEGMLGADANEWVNVFRVIKAGILSYLNIYVGINAAREFHTEQSLGGALGAVVYLTGVSADTPLTNIFTGEALSSGQGGVIGVIFAVWLLSVIHRNLSRVMPKSLDLIVTSFVSLFVASLATIFLIMPLAGWVSDGILVVVTGLLELGGAVAGFILAAIWLPMVMLGLHHFMTPIHVQLIAETGSTILLPILTMAGAGQVGAALALWFRCRKNKALTSIIAGGLPAGILGIGEPLIYGVTLPLGRPFVTACLGAGFGGAFIACFSGVGATSIGATGILMIPLITNGQWLVYVGGLIISYIAGFIITSLFGVPEDAKRATESLDDLEDLEIA